MTVQLALYKGPAQDLGHKIAHWAIRLFQRSKYSHAELVIDGMCYSASPRDGGVRKKKIDLDSGKWDVYDLPYADGPMAQTWAEAVVAQGAAYDWLGVARYVLPFLPQIASRWYCYEFVAYSLELDMRKQYSAESLRDAALFAHGGWGRLREPA